MRRHIIQLITLLAVSWLAAPASAANVERFSPQGEQLDIRQAQARFSAPMAALGQSDAAAPFVIQCGVAGNGYWSDDRTWVYDLASTPQAGTTCHFTLKPGLTTLAGEAIDAVTPYSFAVAGPRIQASLPGPGSTLDEDQVFILRLNGAAQADSMAAHGRCEAQGIHEQIPLLRLQGVERQRILRQMKDRLYELGAGLDEQDALKDPQIEVVRCQRTLPANAQLTLVWGAGIATPSGQSNPADQRLEYKVRDHFAAHLRCQRDNAKSGCIPLTPIRLDFTAPVARELLDQVTLKDSSSKPKGKTYRQQKTEHPEAMADSIEFPGPFPANASLSLSLPKQFRDDKGRDLVNAARFPLQFKIGDLPPLIKFAGKFGIIERVAGGLLPITLRNLEPDQANGTAAKVRWIRLSDDADILDWQKRLQQFDNPPYVPDVAQQPDPRRLRLLPEKSPRLVERTLPKPNGAQAFEVVGLPLEKPGFYVLEAESQRLGKALLGDKQPMYVRSSALVTNLAVHFKWGPASSLAWVTRLDLGTPVAGARIAVRDCRGRLFAESSTDKQGMALLPKNLPDPRASEYDCPLYVSARKDDDLSFAQSDWNEGIETWRFGLPSDWNKETRVAHSLLDRTLFRPGESVHMKHIVREKREIGLSHAAKLPPTLQIEHSGSNQRWFLPLSWHNGAATTDWKLPAGAKRGDYSLRLLNQAVSPDSPAQQLEYLEGIDSGAFSVGDFRVPLMRADIDPAAQEWVAARHADLDLSVRYLNGGGAKNLPVKLRAQLEPHYRVDFADFKEYDFALRGEQDNGSEESDLVTLPGSQLKLDANGTGRGRIGELPLLNTPHKLRVEMEYADPNGEIQTVSRTTTWWPANVVLGMRNAQWTRAGQERDKNLRQTHRLEFQAVNLAGKPAGEVPVEASLKLRQTFSHRVRLAGGFYGYNEETRETPIAAACNGKTDAKGKFSCEARIEASGEILVSARALDSANRAATTQHSFWVTGPDDWGFDQANHDRIDLIPEKKRYEPGETARFQVRMPYRTASALVSVEREGVLDARVVELSGKSPVIEIPVKAIWAPNVFVSALVVRGRNDEVKPTALVDLGRPSFKLGIAGIEVGQRANRLEVEVKTDRSQYQIREKAKARVKVRTPEGALPPIGTEVTLAAVDEGLLELAPNNSWNLLEAMLAERGYSMQTFTAQMQITGKRHFGKKALPAGGGGGKMPTRELFDTLLFWQARVSLDSNGEASVEIPLNDSLTSFRIVAIAASENRFGSGKTAIRSSQDLQLISGLSPVVREGDRLQAHFTVRNGSDRGMKIDIQATAKGLKDLPTRSVTLAAGESRELVWPVRIPETLPATGNLEWTLSAKEIAGPGGVKPARDVLKVTQNIHAAVPVRVQSSSLYRLDQTLDLPVALPPGSLPGSGELRATLSASLADGQTGLRDYMRRYPYACLEQKVSKAVATQDHTSWAELSASLPTYLAENGLANFFPGDGRGSVALTAYVLSIADQAGWSLPLAVKTSMQRALDDYLSGRFETRRSAWENPVVLRLAALEALARDGKAPPALISTLKPEPTLWPSSALIDWISILQNTPTLAQREAHLRNALDALAARFTYTGKRINFSNEAGDDLWWMMTSADTNAVRALLVLMPEASWRERLPKLLTGSLARQKDGRWNTTTANAWGVLALASYQQQFEAVKPSGKSFVVLGKDGRLVDWKAFPKGATAFLPLAAPEASEKSPPATLKLKHEGEGQPYVSVTTLAAVPITAPVQRGYSVKREIIPIDQKSAGKWSRGDVLRVRLNINARDDMGWVVVEDPVPAGASILSGGTQRGSALLTQGESNQGDAWPAWQERLFETYRAYYEYVPRGQFKLEYTVRLNSDGQFQMPPTRVEAMYAPEMFGEAPNGVFDVAP